MSWLAGFNAAIKTPLPQAPEVNSSVGPFQLLGDLNGASFMGAFEIRRAARVPRRCAARPGRHQHHPLNVFFQGGNAALTANMGTGLVLDRLLDQPTQFADLGGGFFALGDATANDRFASIRCTGCHTAAAAGERMSNCYSTVIGIIQVHRVSSAQVLGLSRYEARALQAACSVSAVTGYRRFEIIA